MRANRQQVNAKVKRDTDKASVGEAAPQPAGNAGGGAGFIVLGANGQRINPFGGGGWGPFGINKGVKSPFSGGWGPFGSNAPKPTWVSGSKGSAGSVSLNGFRASFGG